MMNEQMAMLEHRLTSKQLPSASTLLDHKLDNIDTVFLKSKALMEQNKTTNFSSHQFNKMNQLKHDIIHQSVITDHQMVQKFIEIVCDEKQKYSFNQKGDESPSQIQVIVTQAVENRRLHMIQHASYITQYKFATYFKNNSTYQKQQINHKPC
ncbi:unnamed protein product [Rotaria sordida]|uniref:Uncharacterized protein n=2 Tax=Rotaria sordida TaxID=392033 RepID=A0A819GLP2_9BILA|nr:unnamed protein product [Rotaria sordida]CAF0893623.1 unnamed protein product [Rotaria sordida]CAF1060523.1 unnamed protein product [Rotaria sordida]CAF1231612.1 unnamed protein product [Rotaria sordida]CAF3887403.1 unnamed protein product [Rotaria sordida]